MEAPELQLETEWEQNGRELVVSSIILIYKTLASVFLVYNTLELRGHEYVMTENTPRREGVFRNHTRRSRV